MGVRKALERQPDTLNKLTYMVLGEPNRENKLKFNVDTEVDGDRWENM